MADVVARRIATHPEARLRLVGYLSAPRDKDRRASLPRLGSIDEISRVAREHDVERVVVTEQEMSEARAEHLIEECKAAGLGLTFLPQHYGLLGPGIELNRLAELPVLDFRFSDPPRSTLAMKRGLDIARLGPDADAALAAAAADRAADRDRLRHARSSSARGGPARTACRSRC